MGTGSIPDENEKNEADGGGLDGESSETHGNEVVAAVQDATEYNGD